MLKNCKRKVILFYISRWFNTADSMENNSDMSRASALEIQPIGETGGEVSAIFRDGKI